VTTATKLREYLLPTQTFTEAYPGPPDPVVPALSSSTSEFEPGARLDLNRLPYHVEGVPHLFTNMFCHFQELVNNYAATEEPVTTATSRGYSAAIYAGSHGLYGTEATVSYLASCAMVPVYPAYHDLTLGGKIALRLQLELSDKPTSVADSIIEEVPGDPLIIWENKSVKAFQHHAQKLQTRLKKGPFSLVREKKQRIWAHDEAMIGKVHFLFDYAIYLTLYIQADYLACNGPQASPKMGYCVWRHTIFHHPYPLCQRFS
jgi:hypothetical protein